MTRKKAILLSITILFVGMIITAGSYAFWSWSSNTNKNIVFNTAKELRNYIVYDEGESKFVGDFQVGDDYTDGMRTTISLYKTSAAANGLIGGTGTISSTDTYTKGEGGTQTAGGTGITATAGFGVGGGPSANGNGGGGGGGNDQCNACGSAAGQNGGTGGSGIVIMKNNS